MAHEIPYYVGLRAYLQQIRDEFYILGKQKQSDELNLPDPVVTNTKTSYGTKARKKPITHSQQMALIIEMLNVVINNMDNLVYKTKKDEYEKRIGELDKYYKEKLDYLKAEVEEAQKFEQEMRNRYISAYEKADEIKRNNPDISEDEIKQCFPLDDFKAAWAQASQKLCKLTNHKVAAESAYRSKTETLIQEYRENEEALRNNTASINNANQAWNTLLATINAIKSNDVVRQYTEDDLDTEPKKGEMSKYDEWRIQKDIETLDGVIQSIHHNYEYNQQFDSIKAVNEKLYSFEIDVADHFDDEYDGVDLEDVDEQQGIISQLQSDDMLKAAEYKKELETLAGGVYTARTDSQKQSSSDRDDYGVIIRDIKEKNTELYDKLIAEKKQIPERIKHYETQSEIKEKGFRHDIENQEKETNETIKLYLDNITHSQTYLKQDLQSKYDEIDKRIKEWKDPEPQAHTYSDEQLSEAENEIQAAAKEIKNNNQAIYDKQREIDTQQKYIDEDLERIAKNNQFALQQTINSLNAEERDYIDFKSKFEAFEKERAGEFSEDFSNEFNEENLNNWAEEYFKLTPKDNEKEIERMINASYEQSKAIGMQLAEQKYKLRKLNDSFVAMSSFRKAAEEEKYKSDKDYQAAEQEIRKQIRQELREESKKKIQGIEEEYLQNVKPYQDELDKLQTRKAIESLAEDLEKITFDQLDDDDNLTEENEIYEKALPEWKELVLKQEKERLERQYYIEDRKVAIEEEYKQARIAALEAVAGFNQKANELNDECDRKIEELKKPLSPADLEVFNNALAARNKLFKQFDIESAEFEEQQAALADQFEIDLQNKLDEMDRQLLWDIENAEKEYNQADIDSRKRLADVLIDINSTSIMSQLLQKREDLKKHNDSLPKDKFDRERPQYAEIINEIKKLEKEIKDLEKQKSEIKILSSQEKDEIYKQEEQALLRKRAETDKRIADLKENHPRLKEEYEKNTRAEFEENQQTTSDNYYADLNKQLGLEDEKNLNEATKPLMAEYVRLKDELQLNLQKNTEEKEIAESKPAQEHIDAENELYNQSIDKLEAQQDQERRNFFEQHELNSAHVYVLKALDSYQRKCSEETSKHLYTFDIAQKKQEYENKIQMYKAEHDIDIAQVNSDLDIELKSIDITKSYDIGNNIEVARRTTNNNLAFNLQRLSQLNAEKTSIPNKIKFVERELETAKKNRDLTQQRLDTAAEQSYVHVIRDTEVVNEYRDKFSQYPQEILNGIVQAQSTRAIKEILKEDIDNWVKENIDISGLNEEERKNPAAIEAFILRASEGGMKVFERIDEASDDAIASMDFKTPDERLQEKTKVFFEIEKDVLSQINLNLRKEYQLYSKLHDVRQAYIDLLGMSEDELSNFNDSIGILTTKELSDLKKSQKNEKHVLLEHINPGKFLQKLDIDISGFEQKTKGQIQAHYLNKMTQASLNQKDDEEVKRKAEYDTKVKAINDVINADNKNIENLELKYSESNKAAETAKSTVDSLKMALMSTEQTIARHDKEITDYNNRLAEINKQLKIVDDKLAYLTRPISKKDPVIVSANKQVISMFNSSIKLRQLMTDFGKLPKNATGLIPGIKVNDLVGEIYKNFDTAIAIVYEDSNYIPKDIKSQKALNKTIISLNKKIASAKANLKKYQDQKIKLDATEATKRKALTANIKKTEQELDNLNKQLTTETSSITSAAVKKISGLRDATLRLESLVETLVIGGGAGSLQTPVTKEQVTLLIDKLPNNYQYAASLASGDLKDKPILNISGANPEIEKQNKEKTRLQNERKDVADQMLRAQRERENSIKSKNEVISIQKSSEQTYKDKQKKALLDKKALDDARKVKQEHLDARQKLGEYVVRKKVISDSESNKIINLADKDFKNLLEQLRKPEAYNLIGKLYKEKHKQHTAIAYEETSLNTWDAKIEELTKELADLKQSQISNKNAIMQCNINIASLKVDKAKYEIYEKGLGEEYDKVKKDFEKAEKEYKELEIKQQNLVAPQQDIKKELDKQDLDPFAKKNNLFKKRRLMDLTVKHLSKTLEQDEALLKKLEEEEKNLFKKYKKLDEYGTVLAELSSIDSPDKLQKAEKDLIDKENINSKKTEINLATISKTESAIEALGNAEYTDNEALKNGREVLEQKHKALSDLYEEKRALEDESKTFPIIKAAHDLISVRQKLTAQQGVIVERKAHLTKAQLSVNVVKNDIIALHNNLSKMLKSKSERVAQRQKAAESSMKDTETAFTTKKDAAEKQLTNLKEQLASLKNKGTELEQTLQNRKNVKDSYIEENNRIDKLNQEERDLRGVGGIFYKKEQERLKEAEQNIKNKQDEIVKYQKMVNDEQQNLVSFVNGKEEEIKKSKEKYENLIAREKAKIQPNEDAIQREKKNMRQTMLNEYKLISEKTLKVDKFNKLSKQRDKIESFQRDNINKITNVYPEDEIRISEEAISKTNRELHLKMKDLVDASKKVKKWYAKNSADFTAMIDAVKLCADLEKNGGDIAAPGLLKDAIDNATNYIRVRSADKIQTGSLLRKSRLALANDIIRTCRLMSEQYDKLVKDKHLSQKEIDEYNENKRRIQELKASQKSENIFKKFCRLFIKPLFQGKEKYKPYRDRDAQFKQYLETIHTKEWDKVVQEQALIQLEYKKQNPNKNLDDEKNYQSPNMKEKYQVKFDKDAKVMRDEQNDKGEFSNPMVSEMEQYGLAHIIKKNDDSDGLIFHKFRIEDQNKYDSVNAEREKQNVDNDITEKINQKNFKLVVEPKNISNEALERDSILNKIVNGNHNPEVKNSQNNKHKEINLDAEIPGFKPVNKQVEEHNKQLDSNQLIEDKKLQKDDSVLKKK